MGVLMSKKIIAGKTILLNTKTNCTFLASELDEELQTGNRYNDRHIEWTGELDIQVKTFESEIQLAQKEIEMLNTYTKTKTDYYEDKLERMYISLSENNIELVSVYSQLKIKDEIIESFCKGFDSMKEALNIAMDKLKIKEEICEKMANMLMKAHGYIDSEKDVRFLIEINELYGEYQSLK